MSNPKYVEMTKGFDAKLAHLVEECGELLAAAGKTQRWGPFSVNPELPRHDAAGNVVERETNVAWLCREMDDVHEAIQRLKASIAVGEVHGADKARKPK